MQNRHIQPFATSNRYSAFEIAESENVTDDSNEYPKRRSDSIADLKPADHDISKTSWKCQQRRDSASVTQKAFSHNREVQ